MLPVTAYDQVVDIDQLTDILPIGLMESTGFRSRGIHQVAITHSAGRPGDWLDGTGNLFDPVTKEMLRHTKEFTVLNQQFEGTYLEQVIDLVKDLARTEGVQIGRIRLMRLLPKTCLSLHRDAEEFRYHIPISTSKSAFFVVDDEVHRMPDAGRIYKLHTKGYHTAVNAHISRTRYHLVFDTYGDDDAYKIGY